jgi:hypothetical protein
MAIEARTRVHRQRRGRLTRPGWRRARPRRGLRAVRAAPTACSTSGRLVRRVRERPWTAVTGRSLLAKARQRTRQDGYDGMELSP